MKKLGLVFAGGGGKGSYQIGVWKALKLLGIDKYVTGVSGTSIGALNSIMFAQNKYDNGEMVWFTSSQEKMLPVDTKLIVRNFLYVNKCKNDMVKILDYADTLDENGVVSRVGLLNTINENIDIDLLKTRDIPCFITCTQIPDLKAEYFELKDFLNSKEQLRDLLYATTAIPLVFNKVKIGDNYYMDGGILDNVPIKPLYERNFDIIIVVYFNEKDKIDKSLYPNSKIIEITPSKPLGGWITGTFDFSRQAAIDKIIEGYKDTIKVFDEVLPTQNEDNILEILETNYEKIEKNIEMMVHQKETLEDNMKKIKQLAIINKNIMKISKEKYQRVKDKKRKVKIG